MRLHLHRYRTVQRTDRDRYRQCRCGKRTWTPLAGGYWPVDRDWLDGAGVSPWDRPPNPIGR
jgi:hypothetical protein